jgi:hypothetical protein
MGGFCYIATYATLLHMLHCSIYTKSDTLWREFKNYLIKDYVATNRLLHIQQMIEKAGHS